MHADSRPQSGADQEFLSVLLLVSPKLAGDSPVAERLRALGVRVLQCENLPAKAGPTANAVLIEADSDGPWLERTLAAGLGLEPRLPVLVLANGGKRHLVIEAMRLGADDCLVSPCDALGLHSHLIRLVGEFRSQSSDALSDTLHGEHDGAELIGNSRPMLRLLKLVGRAAATDVTVLIRGETGTGKELVARAVHSHSARAKQPLVAVNCAAIPESLLESELFGHEKGAFTGANERRIGRFEQAQDGSVLLDEIGDMSLAAQAKLLRALQSRCFERVGGRETVQLGARVLAATHCDLESLVASGRFRADLYHRLCVLELRVPALRERVEDIPALAQRFLARARTQLGGRSIGLSAAALELLTNHPWPGNVRELEHRLLEAGVHAAGPIIQPEHLRLAAAGPYSPAEELPDRFLDHMLSSHPGRAHEAISVRIERELATLAMRRCNNNLSAAARILGISRPTLRSWIRSGGTPP